MKQSIKVCLFLCMGIYSLHGAAAEASALAEVLFNGVTKGGAKVVKKRPAVHSSSVPLFKNSTVNVQRGGGLKKWSQEFNQRPLHVTGNVRQEFITLEEDADKYFFPPVSFEDPLGDMGFKKLFSTPKNTTMIIKVLNELLNLQGDDRIRNISFHDKEFMPDKKEGKRGIVDVYCRDHLNRGFVVEMQKDKDYHYLNRAQNYLAKAYTSQFNPESTDYDKGQPFYLISFVNHILFPNEKGYLSRHKTVHTGSHHCYLDKMQYVFVELPKFDKVNGRIETALDEFLYLLKNMRKISAYPSKSHVFEVYETMDKKNWSDADLRVATKMRDLRRLDEIKEEEYKKAMEEAGAADEKARAADEKARTAEESLRQSEEKSKVAEEKSKVAEEKSKVAEEKSKAAEEKLSQMNIDTALKLITFKLSTLQISEATGLQATEIEKLRVHAKK